MPPSSQNSLLLSPAVNPGVALVNSERVENTPVFSELLTSGLGGDGLIQWSESDADALRVPLPGDIVQEETCPVTVVAMPDYEEVFNFSFFRSRGNAVNGVHFRDEFLDNLLRSSPEVGQKMVHGDLETCRATLVLSIDHLARFYASGEPSDMLQGAASRQSQDERNIEPHLYEFFMQALLQTLQQYDPKYNEEVGKAWEEVLRPGIEYMKRMYRSSSKAAGFPLDRICVDQ